ncbi:MAG: hypothetical protein FJY25_15130 [Betaproteobacteria bacterium]|nr:hypothetical protein [Betaproteobacteria bacterium]
MIQVLREQESRDEKTESCRRYGISSATLHKRKMLHGGPEVSDARRLRKLMVEQMSNTAVPKDAATLNGAAGGHMRGHGS